MGLSTRFVVVKAELDRSLEVFIQDLGFEVSKKVEDKSLLSCRILPENQIAIGVHNGFIYICHHELPMYLIYGEMSRKNYPKANNTLNEISDNGRYIAAIFQSSINGFGYGIHDKGELQRYIMGDYEDIMYAGGDLQAEELSMINSTTNKVNYSGKEYDLHEAGTELTEAVLDHYCGQHFLMDDLVMSVFQVK